MWLELSRNVAWACAVGAGMDEMSTGEDAGHEEKVTVVLFS